MTPEERARRDAFHAELDREIDALARPPKTAAERWPEVGAVHVNPSFTKRTGMPVAVFHIDLPRGHRHEYASLN